MSAPIMEPPPPTPEQLAAWAEAEREAERELAAADAAAAGAAAKAAVAPTAAPAPAGPAPGHAMWWLLAVGVGLLTAASSVGSALVFCKAPVLEPHVERTAPAAPAEPISLEVIDVQIKAASYTEALELCKRAAAEQPPARRGGIAYREGLCLEALGRLKEAAAAYRRAEPAHGDRAAWASAVLGQVRCALASGDLGQARNHLDRVVLRAGHPDCAGSHVGAECQFLRAQLAVLQLGPVAAMDPFAPTAVAWPPLGAAVDRYFDWLPPDAPHGSSGGPAAPNTVRVHQVAGRAGEFEATAHLAERPVADALRALAAAANLALELPAPVAEALTREVVVLDVEAAPLGEVLDALVGRHGVVWKLDGNRLTVALGAAAPNRGAAVAGFQRAAEAVSGHPSSRAVRVWLANFAFESGNPREAARIYQQLVEAAPEAPEVPYAVYNLGLVDLSAGALPTARSRFVDLADRAPRTRWADYAWWWVGRTHLDVGDFTAAKRALESALRGRTSEVCSAAALGTCALELLEGGAQARAALEAHRGDARPEHAALRTALDAAVRYRTSPTAGRRSALVDALRAARDAGALGPGGTYLAGRIYRDLGLAERTITLFDAAALTTRGPLAQRMTFEVAEWYDLLERSDDARQRYLAIAATDPRGFGPKAELALAALALREKKTEECLRRCRVLLARGAVDRIAVLGLMGRGFEQKKNYRAAADCFAGRVPGE
jgi:tetratricopeptide (TPR) repeat protein